MTSSPEETAITLPRRASGSVIALVLGSLAASGTFGLGAISVKDVLTKLEAIQGTLTEVRQEIAVLKAANLDAKVRALEIAEARRDAELELLDARLKALEARRP